MNAKCEKWYSLIEEDRIALEKLLANIPPEQFTRQPKTGQWSIAEIVSHLITADRLSLDYMKKKSQAIESLDDVGLVEEFKMLLFIISQRAPLKFKAPFVVSQNTPNTVDISILLNQWETLRKDIKKFITKIPEPFIKRKIYRHPFLGRIDAKLFLQATYEHYHHHLPQIKRLL